MDVFQSRISFQYLQYQGKKIITTLFWSVFFYIGTRITPNKDTFYAVYTSLLINSTAEIILSIARGNSVRVTKLNVSADLGENGLR